jgi:hypothetical protein
MIRVTNGRMSAQPNSPEEAPLDPLLRRKLLFRMLAILWIFPSAGAGWIIVRDFHSWKHSDGVLQLLSSIRLEDWVAFFLLLAQLWFVVQAIRYSRCSDDSIATR